MKFSHSLQFNAVPEWSSKYLSYSSLKKLIYSLQKESLLEQGLDDELALLTNKVYPEEVFRKALDGDLLKIDSFYKEKEKEYYENFETLIQDIADYQNEFNLKADLILKELELEDCNLDNDVLSGVPVQDVLSLRSAGEGSPGPMRKLSSGFHDIQARNKLLLLKSPEIYADTNEDSEEDDDEEEGLDARLLRRKSVASDGNSLNLSIKSSPLEQVESGENQGLKKSLSLLNSLTLKDSFLILSDIKITLKKRIILLFTSLSELKSFIELNRTGFKKILKKFDKSLQSSLKHDYLTNTLVNNSYVFRPDTMDVLSQRVKSVLQLYANIACNGSLVEAESELKLQLREHVVWERNTVWRDMINIERKSQAANIFASKGMIGNSKNDKELTDNAAANLQFSSLFNGQLVKIGTIVVIMVLAILFSPFEEREQRNCFALLIGASLLWATESIPLFVTSLAIPLLVILLKVLKYDDDSHPEFGKTMTAPDASKYILGTMWSSVIMLLLGGFTLAAALSKYSITRIFSTMILSKSGTNPHAILLTIMLISLFVSAVVSNVAAPVLCYSIIQPLLRTLPTNSNFAKSLILGVAFASNLGGMSSPISSPQNIIAIELMDPQPSWIQWFVISIPVCLVSLLLIWIFLLFTFKVTGSTNIPTDSDAQQIKILPIQPSKEKLTPVQWFIVAVSVITIGLWCLANNLSPIFGEIGIISMIPIVLFFGSGILTSEDWNNFLWTIVALAMGGIALGKAVASSGLLKTIAGTIQEAIVGMQIYQICLIFGLLCLVISTFISHTVSALILLPLIKEIGQSISDEYDYSRLLIMINVLLCSTAMGLPTSGFPNVTAICMTDGVGHSYVNVKTFVTRGFPSSFIAYIVIVTIGYLVMTTIHF